MLEIYFHAKDTNDPQLVKLAVGCDQSFVQVMSWVLHGYAAKELGKSFFLGLGNGTRNLAVLLIPAVILYWLRNLRDFFLVSSILRFHALDCKHILLYNRKPALVIFDWPR